MDRKYKKLLRFILPYLALEIQILVCVLMDTLLNLADPILLKLFIDDAMAQRNPELLFIIMITLVLLVFIRSGSLVLVQYLFGYTGQRILFDIRLKLFEHVEKLGLRFFDRERIGEVLSRIQNDVAQLRTIMTETMVQVVSDVLLVIGTIVIVLLLNWKLAILALLVVPCFFITLRIANPRVRHQSRLSQDKSAEIMSFLEQVFSGIRLVKSTVMEKHEARRLVTKARELINIRMKLVVISSFTMAVITLFGTAGPLIVLGYGGVLVIRGEMSLGGLMAFYLYISRLFTPVNRLARVNVTIQRAMASVDRIFEFMDQQPEVIDCPDAPAIRSIHTDLELRDVAFGYRPNQQVLEGISFRLERGKKIALVGPTGSGKSTVANLLCRFYEPQQGSIHVDGRDIREYRLSSYRQRITLLAQEAFLFSTSVRENIIYGNRRASDEEIENAARLAHIHQDIQALPQGWDTEVGERGYQLSGGQRQRIALARGLLAARDVLIFDEATSALDPQTEKSVQQAVEQYCQGRMMLVIAHRISTVMNAEEILVLDQGRVIERGTHSRLYGQEGLYRRLYDEQFRDEGKSQTVTHLS